MKSCGIGTGRNGADRDRPKWLGCKTWNLLCLSQILHSSDPSTIEASNFQTDKKNWFIIHGFRDKGDESWLVAMCKAGPSSNPCGLCHRHTPFLPMNASTSLYAISVNLETGNPDILRFYYAIKMPLHKNKKPFPHFWTTSAA